MNNRYRKARIVLLYERAHHLAKPITWVERRYDDSNFWGCGLVRVGGVGSGLHSSDTLAVHGANGPAPVEGFRPRMEYLLTIVRALITGASGFAGRALTAHLRDVGDDVIPWSRANGDPDITDRPSVVAALSESDAAVVYHLAAQSNVPRAWEDPETTHAINVGGTQNILDGAIANGAMRVIVVTSSAVYGAVPPEELPVVETSALRPRNPYAASKVAADEAAVTAHEQGLDVIRLRAFNHFGPGQSTIFASSGFAHRIALASRSGTTTIEVGSLDARRDFTDVRDVVRAYRCAATDGESGEVYNVCSGTDRSMREIAEGLVNRSGSNISFRVSPELKRPVETPVVRGSAERLFEQTGWQPEIPLNRASTTSTKMR